MVGTPCSLRPQINVPPQIGVADAQGAPKGHSDGDTLEPKRAISRRDEAAWARVVDVHAKLANAANSALDALVGGAHVVDCLLN